MELTVAALMHAMSLSWRFQIL